MGRGHDSLILLPLLFRGRKAGKEKAREISLPRPKTAGAVVAPELDYIWNG